MPSARLINFSVFLTCIALMLVAFYFEYVKELEPCPLCMAQRVVVVAIGLIAGLAALQNPKQWGLKVYGVTLFLVALAGIGLAARQVWLQHLPEDLVPACGPGIYYMLDVFPMQEVLTNMLMGTGDCAEVVWQDPVLQLSIPSWTLIWFSFMALVFITHLFRKPLNSAEQNN
ncbi:MAG: disulfide bond formation protein B [Pseudomonadales bacterium]|uniref:Disulfide bond formation protein B n=1 Tax=Oleiphilus messinensis TaxID=141451 RepID=A0A1Y0I1X1_9GAMM|nr:disulfide bond formation protein B [Oleiphilus messinensis]ARU54209.1 disulfide bond formation protein DsbB [Oleiphilus messinensis]MCG8613649.1 disulfide bond formation protein B [Pseudomonadales bacterium]